MTKVKRNNVEMAELSSAADVLHTIKTREQYDAEVKHLFSEKVFLAVLLETLVEECNGLTREEIVSCIEGDVQIAKVPLNPQITGDSNEDAVPGEGVITFDLRFHMQVPEQQKGAELPITEFGTGTITIKLLINLEFQRKYHVGYDLVPRSIFYGCRMISSQKAKEFTKDHYDDIKKVYSIWICMNVPRNEENSIVKYAFQPEILDGTPDLSKHRYDLMNIVMIGIPKELPKPGEHDLHRFIKILLSGEIELEEKKELLQEDYNIPMTESVERRIFGMCNFSDEIWENGIEAGMEKVNRLIQLLMEQNRTDDLLRSTQDAEFQQKLLKEFNLM